MHCILIDIVCKVNKRPMHTIIRLNIEFGPMSDTSIRVSTDLADELHKRKSRGDSYEDVIWRLIEKADMHENEDNK